MMKKIFQTDDDISRFVLRVLLALVFFPHGAQKVFGWFGGYGFSATMESFEKMGIPAFLALCAILAESLGPLGLFTGLLTRHRHEYGGGGLSHPPQVRLFHELVRKTAGGGVRVPYSCNRHRSRPDDRGRRTLVH